MRPWPCRDANSRGFTLELDAHRKIARHPARQPERPQAPAHPASAPQLLGSRCRRNTALFD